MVFGDAEANLRGACSVLVEPNEPDAGSDVV
jgi:hypothetical protein